MGTNEKKLSWRPVVTAVLAVLALAVTGGALLWGGTHIGVPGSAAQTNVANLGIMDRFDMRMTNEISNALDGVLSIEKVYWLDDADLIAPEPDQSKFGKTGDPAQMQEFLDRAGELLAGQPTLFTPQTQIYRNSEITYYLDETIMVISWQEMHHNSIYTISEVKIAHPSQFRRFVADGVYGSERQYYTTQMAQTVNAVTASAGDFYKFRLMGVSVYEGEVKRVDNSLDTCYITDEGDMIFSYRGQLGDPEKAQKFVDENHVRFSLAFGPVLVDNYRQTFFDQYYPLGEPGSNYSRAALAKMGDLHYLLITSNRNEEGSNKSVPSMDVFARQIAEFGVEKAYALDGGQTATIVTNDVLMNKPDYGGQRQISDIIYFATAIPDGG